MNKDTVYMLSCLTRAGIAHDDAMALRRISMTLHNWHEKECGFEYSCLERDEVTGKPFWVNSRTMRRSPIADLERGALKRLNTIMAKYPNLSTYVQGDPRGAALYILRPGDVPEGEDVDSYYSRGLPVYK